MTSSLPSAKVTVGALAGAVAALVMWILSEFGVDAPPGIEGVLATVIGGVAAYLTPPSQADTSDDPPGDHATDHPRFG